MLTTAFADDLLVAALGIQSFQAVATADAPFIGLASSRGVETCLDMCSITRHTAYRIVDAVGPSASTWSSVSAGGTIEIAAFRARTQPPNGLPVPNVVPMLSGIPHVGATVTTNTGGWSGASTHAYEWLVCDADGRDCVLASGAGAGTSSYVVSPMDAVHTLRARVTASNANGPGRQVLSAPSRIVEE